MRKPMNSESVNTRSFKRRSQRTRTGPQQGTNDLHATLDPPGDDLGVFLRGERSPAADSQ